MMGPLENPKHLSIAGNRINSAVPGRKTSRREALAALAVLPTIARVARAGIRGNGRYDGIVFFDRWDSCYLFSGAYVMYISRRIKEILRPYAGRAMEIDAQEVWQPMNPGDGLIRKLAIVGEARMPANGHLPSVDGIRLRASVSVQGKGAAAEIDFENTGGAPVSISARDAGFAVFTNAVPPVFPIPTDSRSFALITRASLDLRGGSYRFGDTRCAWRPRNFPPTVLLEPHKHTTALVALQLPRGQFQFVAGYGGGVHAGPCTPSNAVSFDAG